MLRQRTPYTTHEHNEKYPWYSDTYKFTRRLSRLVTLKTFFSWSMSKRKNPALTLGTPVCTAAPHHKAKKAKKRKSAPYSDSAIGRLNLEGSSPTHQNECNGHRPTPQTYGECLSWVAVHTETARQSIETNTLLPPCKTQTSLLLKRLDTCIVCWDEKPLYFYVHHTKQDRICWRHPLVGCMWCPDCTKNNRGRTHVMCRTCASKLCRGGQHADTKNTGARSPHPTPDSVTRCAQTVLQQTSNDTTESHLHRLNWVAYRQIFGFTWWAMGGEDGPGTNRPAETVIVKKPCPVCRDYTGIPLGHRGDTINHHLRAIGGCSVMETVIAEFGPHVCKQVSHWFSQAVRATLDQRCIRSMWALPLSHCDCYDMYCPHRFEDWCHILDWFIPQHLAATSPQEAEHLAAQVRDWSPQEYIAEVRHATRAMLAEFLHEDIRVQLVNIHHVAGLVDMGANPAAVDQATEANDRLLGQLGMDPCPAIPVDPTPCQGALAKLVRGHAMCLVILLRYGRLYTMKFFNRDGANEELERVKHAMPAHC